MLDPLRPLVWLAILYILLIPASKLVSEAVPISKFCKRYFISKPRCGIRCNGLFHHHRSASRKSLRPPGTLITLDENEQQLENLRCRCEKSAGELLPKLDTLKVKGNKNVYQKPFNHPQNQSLVIT
jgi:hypothetical protein